MRDIVYAAQPPFTLQTGTRASILTNTQSASNFYSTTKDTNRYRFGLTMKYRSLNGLVLGKFKTGYMH